MENNLAEMFYILCEKIGKSKEDIVRDFSKSNRQLLFEFNEVFFNGYSILSEGELGTDMGDYELEFCMAGNICHAVRMYIREEELLKDCLQHCSDNFPLLTNDTWLVTDPKAAILFYYKRKTKDEQTEHYFESGVSGQKFVHNKFSQEKM